MTNEEINAINKLRKNGAGYKKIARILNLPVNSVKSFISRNKDKTKTHCLFCGLKIINKPKRKPRKFCSSVCKRRYVAAHPEQINSSKSEERTCLECGKKFICYKSVNKKYCSHSCYIRSRYEKDGDYNE